MSDHDAINAAKVQANPKRAARDAAKAGLLAKAFAVRSPEERAAAKAKRNEDITTKRVARHRLAERRADRARRAAASAPPATTQPGEITS